MWGKGTQEIFSMLPDEALNCQRQLIVSTTAQGLRQVSEQ